MTLAIPQDFSPAPDLLHGRHVLVTGAGDGLGRATALACARAGATVVLVGRTVKKLEAAYDAIESSGGARPAIYPLNLAGATWKDYADLAGVLERELPALDGLVHCAAHFRGFTTLASLDPKDWLETLQVNLTAPYALTRHCLPLLERSAAASVVFVGDAPGRRPRAFQGAYGVSKAAVESLAATWASEHESRGTVRFNTFDPGPMRTGLRLKGYPGEPGDAQPLPDAAAGRIVWLLSDAARGITGAAL